MKSFTRRVLAAAGAAAMAGGIMAATAMPASAASPDPVAYAAQSNGPLGFVPPIGFTSSPGTEFRHLDAVPLLGTMGLLGINDQSEPDFASSSIAAVAIKASPDGPRVLSAYNVEASCGIDGFNDAFGGTTLQLGRLWLGGVPVFLPTDPDPNTFYAVPGFGTVELNRQVFTNGSLTVTAIQVVTEGQRTSIGVVRCDGAVLTNGKKAA